MATAAVAPMPKTGPESALRAAPAAGKPAGTGGLTAFARRAESAGATASAEGLLSEARSGARKLGRMSHDELKALISDRVRLLDTTLDEREARRAAIEEATIAQCVIEARRHRARRIRHRVNIGSTVVAAMFAGVMVVSLF